MTPLEMIKEWRKGCPVATSPEHPEECHPCTVALIEAIERYELSKLPNKEEEHRVA